MLTIPSHHKIHFVLYTACEMYRIQSSFRRKMTFNAADGLKPLKSPKSPLHTFTSEQVSLLLNQPNRHLMKGIRDYAIMLVLLDTGIRLAELCQLKMSDVMADEGYIVIPKAKAGNPEWFLSMLTSSHKTFTNSML